MGVGGGGWGMGDGGWGGCGLPGFQPAPDPNHHIYTRRQQQPPTTNHKTENHKTTNPLCIKCGLPCCVCDCCALSFGHPTKPEHNHQPPTHQPQATNQPPPTNNHNHNHPRQPYNIKCGIPFLVLVCWRACWWVGGWSSLDFLWPTHQTQHNHPAPTTKHNTQTNNHQATNPFLHQV